MLKSVMKEIFILLLLSIAILLILGILFYEYIPINRVIPEREAYVTPNEVLNEIEEEITESEKIEVTYEVTDADLNVYKQTGSYTEGRANPFSLEPETTTNTSDNGTGNSGTTNSETGDTNENNGQTTIDENSTGTFFNNEGIK